VLAHGAISIVNAISTGKGAAIGIDLPVHVIANVTLNENSLRISFEGEIPPDRKLVDGCISVIKGRYNLPNIGGELLIASQIPIAHGLKSSSAVANAIIQALLTSLEIEYTDDDILALSVDAAIKSHKTITGALDDAAASYYGGIIVADNLSRKILQRKKLERDYNVLLFVPMRKVFTETVNVERYRRLTVIFEKALDFALYGMYWNAMLLNTIGVSLAMSYWDTFPLLLESLKAGAVCSGISGKGPAVSILYTESHKDVIIELWKEQKGKVILTRTTNKKSEVIVK